MLRLTALALACLGLTFGNWAHARHPREALFLVAAPAKDAVERTRIADAGVAIDTVLSDSVMFIASSSDLAELTRRKIPHEATPLPQRSAGFEGSDGAYHDYAEMTAELTKIAQTHPNIATLFTLGKSLEGRDLLGVRLSSQTTADSLPTAIFMGCHHAREHLSVEVPLMLAQHLAAQYGKDARITRLLDTREVWIAPMVNPDGAEYDISGKGYKYWRKNRRENGDGTFGVDLNRNYGKGFGGSGASSSPSSDTFHGPSAFSEPETLAVRDFVRARTKTTVLLSFHTFSELVLWPYGHTHSDVPNTADLEVFETMGKTMAKWNGYKPMKSSGLYLASGDTTDWAYDERGIFAFTFELSPSSMFSGGFYPGAKAIEPTFKANLEPTLYLIEMADNPHRARSPQQDPLGIL